jgi:hypothetical protein
MYASLLKALLNIPYTNKSQSMYQSHFWEAYKFLIAVPTKLATEPCPDWLLNFCWPSPAQWFLFRIPRDPMTYFTVWRLSEAWALSDSPVMNQINQVHIPTLSFFLSVLVSPPVNACDTPGTQLDRTRMPALTLQYLWWTGWNVRFFCSPQFCRLSAAAVIYLRSVMLFTLLM